LRSTVPNCWFCPPKSLKKISSNNVVIRSLEKLKLKNQKSGKVGTVVVRTVKQLYYV